MNKYLLTLSLALLVLAGCGSSTTNSAPSSTSATTVSAKPEEQVLGTWKVDMALSKMPGMTASEKAEGESIRTEVKADGTFTTKSSKETSSGTWKLAARTVTFAGGNHQMPPTMTLSDDGAKLTFSMDEGGQPASIVMVKE